MAEAVDDGDWVIDRLYEHEPLPIGSRPHLLDSDDAARAGVLDADGVDDVRAGAAREIVGDSELPDPDVNAPAKRAAVWLSVGVLAAAVAIAAGFVMFSGGPGRATLRAPTPPGAAVVGAPPTPAAAPASDDAIPFTASAPGCKPGSTAAQSLSDTAGDSAWVCVRGTPDEQVDGQVLTVDFTCDAARPQSACSYLVNAVSATPGWVAKNPGDKDEWLQHRVVTRLQYNFYNGSELAEILTQDTGDVHGPASATLPRPVLASRVTVVVLQTSRAPVSPLPSNGPTTSVAAEPGSGLIDPGPGPGGVAPVPDVEESAAPHPLSPAPVSDPADATFAVSAMQFFGHRPN